VNDENPPWFPPLPVFDRKKITKGDDIPPLDKERLALNRAGTGLGGFNKVIFR